MNDILHGRRHLSVQRAIELSRFLRLSTVETEHLIYLSLTQAEDESTAAFARKLVKSAMTPIATTDHAEPSREESIFQDIHKMAAFALKSWKRAHVPFAEAARRLALPAFSDERHYDEVCALVEQESSRTHLVREITPADSDAWTYAGKIQTQYLKNTMEYLNVGFRRQPRSLSSAFILLKRTDVAEALHLVKALRGRLGALSRKAVDAVGDDVRFFQYDLNVFPLDQEPP